MNKENEEVNHTKGSETPCMVKNFGTLCLKRNMLIGVMLVKENQLGIKE